MMESFPVLHHVSFSARSPGIAAKAIAKLLDCAAIPAPCPPFPSGSWFVCLGDANGTLLELLPWGHVQDKDQGVAKAFDAEMRPKTSTHILMQTPRTVAEIAQIASEEGWAWAPGSAGFFQFTKVWVEGCFLLELVTAEQAVAYTATFGVHDVQKLDQQFRELERQF